MLGKYRRKQACWVVYNGLLRKVWIQRGQSLSEQGNLSRRPSSRPISYVQWARESLGLITLHRDRVDSAHSQLD